MHTTTLISHPCASCAPCPISSANSTINATAEPARNYSIANQYCGNILEEKQPWNFHKRVISFSLFPNASGVIPEFLIHGLRQNIISAKRTYPEWILRLYVIDVPETFIKEFGSDPLIEIVKCKTAGTNAKKMLWRFLVYDDPKVAVSLIRDLDGRLSYREMFAVHEWLSSGLGFHAVRDHMFHVIPIMGGVFGMRRGVLGAETMESIITTALKRYPGGSPIPGCCADDQNFLSSFIWPKVSSQAMSTDSSQGRCFGAKVCKDFPIGPRTDTNYIGNPFKESKTQSEQCTLNCVWT